MKKIESKYSEEDEEFSKYFPARYFSIQEKSDPKIKIKISEYYIRNYEDIRDSCFLLSNSKDNDHEKNRNKIQ